jgi:hypothetical protein
MPSPFPGMDPYLENPGLWPEVHSRLIVAISDSLAPFLHPKYYAAIETRTYLDTPEDSISIGIADVSVALKSRQGNLKAATPTATLPLPEIVTLPLPEEVTERYLEIRDTKTAVVITTLEILSPKNKRAGEGRRAYLRKRQQVLSTQTHFIEIDLLRSQAPMPLGTQHPTDYRILVSRSHTRPKAELYGFDLQDPIPKFAVPLELDDVEPVLNLKSLLEDLYDRAGYGFRVNYQSPPQPALSPEDQTWACRLVS